MSSFPDRAVVDRDPRELLLLTTLGRISEIAGQYAVDIRSLIKSNPQNEEIYGLPDDKIAEAEDSLNALSRLLGQLGTNPLSFSVFNAEMPTKDAANQRYSVVMHTSEEPDRQLSWRLVCGQFLIDHAVQKWTRISCLARGSNPAPALVIYCTGNWQPRTHIALCPGEKSVDLPERKEVFSKESLDVLRVFIITLAQKRSAQ